MTADVIEAPPVDEAPPTRIIDQPGVYDLTDAEYHADPVPGGSLSSTGARKLLPPSCPALFRHYADNGGQHKREFDLGHVAHLLVLGAGPEPAIVEEKDWRTKDARNARVQAYRDGKVPVLRAEYNTAVAMAAALYADPLCAALLDPDHGAAEQSYFWIDAEFDVWRRVRPDWLQQKPWSRPKIVDYKTTMSVEPRAISRAVHNWGYHQQQPYYEDALPACGVADDAAFLFIFQMKTAPYLPAVVQLDDDAVLIGRERNARALEIFRDCQASGLWPAHTPPGAVTTISLPSYAERQHLAEMAE